VNRAPMSIECLFSMTFLPGAYSARLRASHRAIRGRQSGQVGDWWVQIVCVGRDPVCGLVGGGVGAGRGGGGRGVHSSTSRLSLRYFCHRLRLV
jgi:hypothetical protein